MQLIHGANPPDALPQWPRYTVEVDLLRYADPSKPDKAFRMAAVTLRRFSIQNEPA